MGVKPIEPPVPDRGEADAGYRADPDQPSPIAAHACAR
jgi:hypothetical protein